MWARTGGRAGPDAAADDEDLRISTAASDAIPSTQPCARDGEGFQRHRIPGASGGRDVCPTPSGRSITEFEQDLGFGAVLAGRGAGPPDQWFPLAYCSQQPF